MKIAVIKSSTMLKYMPKPAFSNWNIDGARLNTIWAVMPVNIDPLLLLYNHVMIIDSVMVFVKNNQNGLFA